MQLGEGPLRLAAPLQRQIGPDQANAAGRERQALDVAAHRHEPPTSEAGQVARQLRAAYAAHEGPAPEALEGGLRILSETDMRDALSSIRQPVMVVHGDRDSLVPLAAGEYLSRRLFDARFLVLRGAGHAPFLSKPEETSAALLEFFDE